MLPWWKYRDLAAVRCRFLTGLELLLCPLGQRTALAPPPLLRRTLFLPIFPTQAQLSEMMMPSLLLRVSLPYHGGRALQAFSCWWIFLGYLFFVYSLPALRSSLFLALRATVTMRLRAALALRSLNLNQKRTVRTLKLWQEAVLRIRIILIRIRIRIQDVKKFVTDPDPGWTLIRIRIQQKRPKYQENLQKVYEKR